MKDVKNLEEDDGTVETLKEKVSFQFLFSLMFLTFQKKKTGERCDAIEECPVYHYCRARKRGGKQKYCLEVGYNSVYHLYAYLHRSTGTWTEQRRRRRRMTLSHSLVMRRGLKTALEGIVTSECDRMIHRNDTVTLFIAKSVGKSVVGD